jgi:ribosomal protein L17
VTTTSHGRYTDYTTGRCRCPLCTKAAAQYNKMRVVRRHQGTWQPFTDAAPVRQYVTTLHAAGVSWNTVATLAGVADTTIRALMTAGRPTIRTAAAAKILAVRPTLDDLPDWGKVDATGSRRRIQALMVAGWSAQLLARLLGVDRSMLRKMMTRPTVRVYNARAIRDLFAAMWNQFPLAEGRYERAVANRTRRYATSRGWVSALAWDDIDDPKAKPKGVRQEVA